MRIIHKYPITIENKVEIETHAQAWCVLVGHQRSTLTLWMEVDTENPKVKRTLYIYGTGHPINGKHRLADHFHNITHMGTVIIGQFVWHGTSIICPSGL